MAYQDIRRAIVKPDIGLTPQDPASIVRLLLEYTNLAQEVVQCHNRIQQFPVVITGGSTTVSVNLPAPAYTTGYIAIFSPSFDAGSWWISSQTKTAVAVTWKTAASGAQSARILIIE